MRVKVVRKAQKTFPTSDKSFGVMQSFPNPIPAEESDPFLMCDHFGPSPSKGKVCCGVVDCMLACMGCHITCSATATNEFFGL